MQLKEKTKEKNYISLIICVGIFLSYVIPFRFFPFSSFYNDSIIIFCIAIAVVLMAKEKVRIYNVPWIVFLPLGLIFWIFLQSIFILDEDSRWDLIFPISYFLIFILSIIVGATVEDKLKENKLFDAIAWAFLLAGLFSAIASLIQFFSFDSLFYPFILSLKPGSRPYANLGQPNHLALLLCFSLAALWHFYKNNTIDSWKAFFSAIFIIAGLILSQSRIVWIILPLFFFFIVFFEKEFFSKKLIFSLIFFLFLYSTGIFLLPFISSYFSDVATTSSLIDRVGSAAQSERLLLYKQAFHMSLHNPIMGVGWYQFGPSQVEMANLFPATPYSRYAHNFILSFAAEIGWPVTVIFLGSLGYWILKNFSISNKRCHFFWLILLAIIVHSMTEFPLWYGYVLFPLGLMIGVVSKKCENNEKRIIFDHLFQVFIFFFIALCLIFFSFQYRKLVSAYDILNFELMGLRVYDSPTLKPNFTVFPKYYNYFDFAKADVMEKKDVMEIMKARKTSLQFGDAPVLTDMSIIYAVNGEPKQAINAMIVMQKLHKCRYKQYYDIWKQRMLENPTELKEVFYQLPLPKSECK